MSWNAYSKQFTDAPEFTLLAFPKTATYRAVIEQGGKSWQIELPRPPVSLAYQLDAYVRLLAADRKNP